MSDAKYDEQKTLARKMIQDYEKMFTIAAIDMGVLQSYLEDAKMTISEIIQWKCDMGKALGANIFSDAMCIACAIDYPNGKTHICNWNPCPFGKKCRKYPTILVDSKK
jgi:hypothetical protein